MNKLICIIVGIFLITLFVNGCFLTDKLVCKTQDLDYLNHTNAELNLIDYSSNHTFRECYDYCHRIYWSWDDCFSDQGCIDICKR